MHARFRLSVRTSNRFIGSSSGGGVCSAIHADTVHIFHTDTVMSVSLEKCHRNRWSATSLDKKINHVQGDPLKHPVDIVTTVPEAGWPLLELPTAQGGWRNHPNLL